MSDKHSQTTMRRQRRLPTIPPGRHHHSFWPTFRGAINWMQNHQDIIDTSINLMEIYPKLIQHKSCDRLWEFISKVSFFDKHKNNRRAQKQTNSKDKESAPANTKKPIPAISVSQMYDDDAKNEKLRFVKNVFICGNVSDKKWHRLILSISEKYAIRCCPELPHGDGDMRWVFDADIVIFLFDNKTVTETYYLEQLNTALAWNLDVVYVRDPYFTLPEPLPDALYNVMCKSYGMADNNHNNFQSFLSKNDTGNSYLKTSNISHLRSRSCNHSTTSNDVSDKNAFLRPGSGHVSISPQSSYSSLGLPELHSHIKLNKHNCTSASHSDTSLEMTQLPECFSRRCPIKAKRQSDMIKTVEAGYESAAVYFKMNHRHCIEELNELIQNTKDARSDYSSCTEESFLFPPNNERSQCSSRNSVPSIPEPEVHKKYDMMPSADSLSVPSNKSKYIQTTQTTYGKTFNDIDSESNKQDDKSSPTETIYLIYDNEGDSPSTPKVVHWPDDLPNDVSNSPSVDSFGFQDIDLSKHLNDMNWFYNGDED